MEVDAAGSLWVDDESRFFSVMIVDEAVNGVSGPVTTLTPCSCVCTVVIVEFEVSEMDGSATDRAVGWDRSVRVAAVAAKSVGLSVVCVEDVSDCVAEFDGEGGNGVIFGWEVRCVDVDGESVTSHVCGVEHTPCLTGLYKSLSRQRSPR